MSTVLVVDDKESLRDSVGFTLQRAGFTILAAPDGAAAAETVARKRPDCVVTDLKMPGISGVDLIDRVKEFDADIPVILMTAFGTVETAVDAMKRGAFDYITKPFEGDELIIAVKRAIEHASIKRENAVLRAASESTHQLAPAAAGRSPQKQLTGFDRIIGDAPSIRSIKDKLGAIADSHGTVLISGESGTGKEVAARAIHEASPRRDGPFLAVNCAAMSESLLESELFSQEKRAVTGADTTRKRRFELAHGGTLLLDEISEVRPQIQAKLLRVLQEQAFERVGSSTTIGVDVRVIATTNRDLTDEVARGAFRQDLYYRLNVLPVHLPPLRERATDIATLAPHFVQTLAQRNGLPARRITPEALELLAEYPWPGNVRELQNLCERAVVLAEADRITPDLIRLWLTSPGNPGRAAKARPRHATPQAPDQHGDIIGAQRPVGFIEHSPASRINGNGNGQHTHALNGRAHPHSFNGDNNDRHTLSHESEARNLLRPGGAESMIEPRPLADIEREVIVETLHRFNGHRQKTAKALGIGVRTLGLKLKKWKEEQLVSQSL